MNERLQKGIVAILKPNGTIEGTGFFVSSQGHILTCWHVVKGNLDGNSANIKLFKEGEPKKAKLVSNGEAHEKDIAFLKLEDFSPPFFFHLHEYSSDDEKPFTTFGFPEGSPDGLIGYGKIGHMLGGLGLWQISSEQIRPGFSGAPVVLKGTEQAVGIVKTQYEDSKGNILAHFYIPVKVARQYLDNSRFFGLSSPKKVFFNLKRPAKRHGMISCNRSEELIHLKRHFDKRKDQKVQHFFIQGRREDKPESLVERFVLESLIPNYSVDYDYHTQRDSNEHVLKIEDLPVDYDLSNSCRIFPGVFVNRLNLGQANAASKDGRLKNFFPENHPFWKKDFFVTVFRIKEDTSLREHLPAFLEWIVEEFCEVDQKGSLKFIFFFILGREERKRSLLEPFLGKKSRNNLSNKVLELTRKHRSCCFLQDLSPVKSTHIQDWFSTYTTYTYEVEERVEKAKQRFERHYDRQKDTFPMHVVEQFLQELIDEETQPAF